mmetsp:Transcript_43791/g.108359  ORF Transcript_43791/g.108359 Transcript_43791/m.108359 type:complete len:99 (-) Transcript_43791:190-486(-)
MLRRPAAFKKGELKKKKGKCSKLQSSLAGARRGSHRQPPAALASSRYPVERLGLAKALSRPLSGRARKALACKKGREKAWLSSAEPPRCLEPSQLTCA